MADQQQGALVSTDDTSKNSVSATQQAASTTAASNSGETISRSEAQELADRAAAAARKDAEDKHRRDAETKARKEAETRLAEQQQFEQLAAQRQQEIDRLSAVATEHEALVEVVAGIIKDRIEALPADLRKLLPASLPVKDQLEWVENAAKAAAKLSAGPPAPGNGVNPRSATAADRAQRIEQDKQRARPAYAL